MTQSPDGVVRDQVSVPEQETGVNTLARSRLSYYDNMTPGLLIVFLIDVETVRQTGEESFYDHVIHRESGFQAPEGE